MNFKILTKAIQKEIPIIPTGAALIIILSLPLISFFLARIFEYNIWLLILTFLLLSFAIYVLLTGIIPKVSRTYFENLPKNLEKKAKRDAARAKRQEKQLSLKKEVDKILSIEKKVKCDDGVTRIYNGFMWGIIKSPAGTKLPNKKGIKYGIETGGNNGYFNVNEIIASDNSNSYDFDLDIETEKWFSEEGVTLNVNEIILKNNSFYKLKNDYNSKYPNTRVRISPALINYLKCINGFFFHATAISRSPERLFSGTIDGKVCVNGILEN